MIHVCRGDERWGRRAGYDIKSRVMIFHVQLYFSTTSTRSTSHHATHASSMRRSRIGVDSIQSGIFKLRLPPHCSLRIIQENQSSKTAKQTSSRLHRSPLSDTQTWTRAEASSHVGARSNHIRASHALARCPSFPTHTPTSSRQG